MEPPGAGRWISRKYAPLSLAPDRHGYFNLDKPKPVPTEMILFPLVDLVL